jgi:hypothetical protein
MWNKKLMQCIRVLEHEQDGEKKMKVVRGVLQAYQDSFSYKVSAALDKKKEELMAKGAELQHQHEAAKKQAATILEHAQVQRRPSLGKPTCNVVKQNYHMLMARQQNGQTLLSTTIGGESPQPSVLRKDYQIRPRIMTIQPESKMNLASAAAGRLSLPSASTGVTMSFKMGAPGQMTTASIVNKSSSLGQLSTAPVSSVNVNGQQMVGLHLPPNFDIAQLTNGGGGKLVFKLAGSTLTAGGNATTFRIKNNQLVPMPKCSDENTAASSAPPTSPATAERRESTASDTGSQTETDDC